MADSKLYKSKYGRIVAQDRKPGWLEWLLGKVRKSNTEKSTTNNLNTGTTTMEQHKLTTDEFISKFKTLAEECQRATVQERASCLANLMTLLTAGQHLFSQWPNVPWLKLEGATRMRFTTSQDYDEYWQKLLAIITECLRGLESNSSPQEEAFWKK